MQTVIANTVATHLIRSINNIPFSTYSYSKFKYGSISTARKFGRELANSFIYGSKAFLEGLAMDRQFILFPSAYYHIPSACTFIAEEFLSHLNRHLCLVGRKAAIMGKIHRELSYHTDYGKMSTEERRRLIAQDSFHIDAKLIVDKYCIFLDDCRITGAHEDELEKLMASIPNCPPYVYAYYAMSEVPDPKIEDYLNIRAVSTLYDLDSIISKDDFFFNVRNIKMMLGATPNEFDAFIAEQKPKFLYELLDWSIGNQYHNVALFKTNFNTLKNFLLK